MESDAAPIADLERIVIAGVGLTVVALAQARAGLELTLGQWRVMVILAAASRGATISEVARRIGVTVPATSRQIRRLERRGLVVVARDEADHRANRAQLTAAGQLLHDAIVATRRRLLLERTADLPAITGEVSMLRRLADSLER